VRAASHPTLLPTMTRTRLGARCRGDDSPKRKSRYTIGFGALIEIPLLGTNRRDITWHQRFKHSRDGSPNNVVHHLRPEWDCPCSP